LPWEKEPLQWASARAKLSILNAGAAEDEHITCAINAVQLAVMEKPQKLGIIRGNVRLFNA